jgi:hypothetical protein
MITRISITIDEVDMEVDTIDNIMDDLHVRHLEFIEIAVNGAEMYILQGMEQMLPATQRVYVKGHATSKDKKANLPGHSTLSRSTRISDVANLAK